MTTDRITPMTLSGTELIALLSHEVPEKTLWSSLALLGLLSDVEGSDRISDEFPPSDEIVTRGTQSLISRGIFVLEGGTPKAILAAEAVAAAFADPTDMMSYQANSDTIEFTSVIVDSKIGYRVVIDFLANTGYEVNVLGSDKTSLLDFFVKSSNALHQSFGAYIFDVLYRTQSGDTVSAFALCPASAPPEMAEAFSVSADGFWVVTTDIPMDGDDVLELSLDGDSMESFRRKFGTLDAALNDIKLRFEMEDSESQLDEASR